MTCAGSSHTYASRVVELETLIKYLKNWRVSTDNVVLGINVYRQYVIYYIIKNNKTAELGYYNFKFKNLKMWWNASWVKKIYFILIL